MLNAFEVHRDDRADSTTSHATITKFTKASNAIIVVDLDVVVSMLGLDMFSGRYTPSFLFENIEEIYSEYLSEHTSECGTALISAMYTLIKESPETLDQMLAAQLLLSARTFYEVILCVHPMNHERLVTLTLGAGYLGKGKQRADPPQASRGSLNQEIISDSDEDMDSNGQTMSCVSVEAPTNDLIDPVISASGDAAIGVPSSIAGTQKTRRGSLSYGLPFLNLRIPKSGQRPPGRSGAAKSLHRRK
ncbi:hypothetical protein AG0111_0g11030 [Alternaria gaisen]|uniref:Uncharacterized protein n=1 Tax=Alternaria gaisen TaxID=167740 RepID=A0ACB6F837_9PLEO|nr:hypothetical protein AG0111_0g11030 [Alternaria gaisen]